MTERNPFFPSAIRALYDTPAEPVGRRSPPLRLGPNFYRTEDHYVDHLIPHQEVYQIGAHLGGSFVVECHEPPEVRDKSLKVLRGRIANKLFGDIHQEVVRAIHELYDEGLHRTKAGETLERLAEGLSDAFRGRRA